MGCFSSRVEAPTEELPGPPAVELDAPTPADTAAPTQPAAALPSATDLGVSEGKLKQWRKLGGGDLEPVLASSAASLLDAQWVTSHAEAGGVLTHRQALPEEAFLSLADLVEGVQQCAAHRRAFLPVADQGPPRPARSQPPPRRKGAQGPAERC